MMMKACRGPRGTHKSKASATDSNPEPSKRNTEMIVGRNAKSQQSWKPLTKSSLLALENVLDLSVLSVLTLRGKEKDESQKHLNLLKNQFMAQCARLPVPPRKYGDILHVSYQFKVERKKSEQGRKTRQTLEENMRSVVGTLEEMEVKMESLEEKCRTMRNRLEEEEENAQEFLQLSEHTALELSALAPRPSNEPSLQEHMMKMVANPCAVVRALQTEPVVEDVRSFLTLAHKQVDSVQTNRDV